MIPGSSKKQSSTFIIIDPCHDPLPPKSMLTWTIRPRTNKDGCFLKASTDPKTINIDIGGTGVMCFKAKTYDEVAVFFEEPGKESSSPGHFKERKLSKLSAESNLDISFSEKPPAALAAQAAAASRFFS